MKKYWIIFIIVLLFISFSCFSTAHNYNEWLVETRNINDNLYKNECVGVEKNHTEEWCNDRKKLSNYTQSFLEVLTEFFSYNLINGFPLLILLIFLQLFIKSYQILVFHLFIFNIFPNRQKLQIGEMISQSFFGIERPI